MARNYARITTAMWDDPDFVALPPGAQRAYLFLLSQRDLSLTGVIVRRTKWHRTSAGYTAADLDVDLKALEDARYIVVDDDSDEVWIRTFMRHDGVLANRNLRKGARARLDAIHSPRLRRMVADQLAEAASEGASDGAGEGASDDLSPVDDAVDRFAHSGTGPTHPVPEAPCHDPSEGSWQGASDGDPQPPATSNQQPTPPSQSEIATDADPAGGDEEPTAGDPLGLTGRLDRARAACEIVGTRTHDDRLTAGLVRATTTVGIDRHRQACIDGAGRDHLERARRLAHDHPDWTPQRIADELTRATVPLEQTQHPAVVLGERERAREQAEAAPVASDAHVRSAADDARRALAGAPRLAAVPDQ